MKIILLTTLPSLAENERLKEEAEKMGHHFCLINLKTFSFFIQKDQLTVAGLEALKADLVIIRGVFSSIKAIAVAGNYLRAKGIRVFDNNFLAHPYSIDKVADLLKLSMNNLPIPKTAYTRDFNDYPHLAKKLGYPLVVKSIRMGKGAFVFKFEKEKNLMAFINQSQQKGWLAKNFLLQQFIPYLYDLRVLIIGSDLFSMRRIPSRNEFRANFSLGGRVEPFKLDDNDRVLAKKALKVIGLSVGGVDILIGRDKRRYLLEVNHTAGFVGMEKASGQNVARLFLKQAIKEAK